MNANDTQYMLRAIELALAGRYITRPNPSVGCVVVKEGRVIAEAHTQEAGSFHAERVALANAGRDAIGATVYVTLEPCSHYGRTPPCTDALIEANVSRVVYAMQDPYVEVSGRGLSALRKAGIEVDGPLLAEQARKVNPGFFRRVSHGLPWLVIKSASSIDGATALASGESKWITGAESRRDVQKLRARSCAIITGVDSIIADDSRLTIRKEELDLDEDIKRRCMKLPPKRIILDSRGRLSGNEVIFNKDAATYWITGPGIIVPENGSTHVQLKIVHGSICLHSVMAYLAELGCNQVMLEAGATLTAAFLATDLVDEWILYQAPVVLGSNTRPVVDLTIASLDEALRFKIDGIERFGHDVRYQLSLERSQCSLD